MLDAKHIFIYRLPRDYRKTVQICRGTKDKSTTSLHREAKELAALPAARLCGLSVHTRLKTACQMPEARRSTGHCIIARPVPPALSVSRSHHRTPFTSSISCRTPSAQRPRPWRYTSGTRLCALRKDRRSPHEPSTPWCAEGARARPDRPPDRAAHVQLEEAGLPARCHGRGRGAVHG